MDNAKEVILKSLKGEISEEIYRILAGMNDRRLLLVCGILRESLLLVSPSEIEGLLSEEDESKFIRKLVKLKDSITQGPLKKERRLVLAAAARFFGSFERLSSVEAVRAAEQFWEDVCRSAKAVIKEKQPPDARGFLQD